MQRGEFSSVQWRMRSTVSWELSSVKSTVGANATWRVVVSTVEDAKYIIVRVITSKFDGASATWRILVSTVEDAKYIIVRVITSKFDGASATWRIVVSTVEDAKYSIVGVIISKVDSFVDSANATWMATSSPCPKSSFLESQPSNRFGHWYRPQNLPKYWQFCPRHQNYI